MGWVTAIFIAVSLSAFADSQPCPERIAKYVDSGIRRVSLTRPENTGNAKKILEDLRDTIHSRVQATCPNAETCAPTELANAVARVTHEVLDEFGPVRSQWRDYLLFTATLGGYVGLSSAIQLYTEPTTAVILSSFLTATGLIVFDWLGAPVLEPLGAVVRRLAYHTNSSGSWSQRGPAQKRQERIYRLTQELVSTIEEEARFTDRQVKTQLSTTFAGWHPLPGETPQAFADRTAYVFAVLLADLVPNYVDLDLSELQFAGFPQAMVARPYLAADQQPAFRAQVLSLLQNEYDPEAKPGSQRLQEYQSVLEAWVGREFAVTSLPQENHQSRTE